VIKLKKILQEIIRCSFW